MTPDDRDRWTPKTPPEKVRAQTAIPVAIEREDTLPMGIDPIAVIARRSKSQSVSMADIQPRVHRLEADVADCRVDVADVRARIESLDGKVDTLVAGAAADREAVRLERHEREERALRRDLAAGERRKIIVLAVLGIVVPTIAAVGAILATVIR